MPSASIDGAAQVAPTTPGFGGVRAVPGIPAGSSARDPRPSCTSALSEGTAHNGLVEVAQPAALAAPAATATASASSISTLTLGATPRDHRLHPGAVRLSRVAEPAQRGGSRPLGAHGVPRSRADGSYASAASPGFSSTTGVASAPRPEYSTAGHPVIGGRCPPHRFAVTADSATPCARGPTTACLLPLALRDG